ncbi:hypothetical protein CAOG_08802 [Capsaspora owczarzaki ATCC 30864]|uniref:Saposin B-type domain-containing protein n=1 Tax=Capsaspora owczarzaki (strain ATCC 30864) TaxID=595528 RepID=A0A0D2WRN0_CAPO3|nr:hypothetical protein CAOG_08802 [Capsaspora owczarzaki ATCC 30864]KJE93948.1 hypothetical protein CAOG_008802 [Capsaspora owczarzaki ATCC 30864]|eukprot:XP_011270442.1 hypothetical protein CAOG_08802 [Capsaspora owczarzaki ATCC 30864]
MRAFVSLAALLGFACLFLIATTPAPVAADDNGGVPCAVCTLLTGLVGQLAEIHNETVADSMARFCSYLPASYQTPCAALVKTYGPTIIDLYEDHETADMICLAIGICNTSSGTRCHAFPEPADAEERANRALKIAATKSFIKPCDIPEMKPICDLVNRFGNEHVPIDDLDQDMFSQINTFRGADWRGKDCNEFDAAIHPGRNPGPSSGGNNDLIVDTNCNGIYGSEGSTTYEEKFCGDSGQLGIILLGDSVGAHFRIPPEYLNALQVTSSTYKNLDKILPDEFDWPMHSFSTGHRNATGTEDPGTVDSLYLRLVARNRCNHRDFQNVGVNGARSGDMVNFVKQSVARNPKKDYPAIVVASFVGNDVCNGHPGTDHMTTAAEFRANIIAGLDALNMTLAPGSHVLLNGLANGSVLYEYMHALIHPIGEWKQNVNYADVYTYLNCLGISPCEGWMTTNATLRDLTTQRAVLLSSVLQELASNVTITSRYSNVFDMYYLGTTIEDIIEEWIQEGNNVADLIEPVDGFHPRLGGEAMMAALIWDELTQYAPQMIGKVNPNNDAIISKFGDQGGY